MSVPEPVSQGMKWALVVGLAFFSADATSALIQRQLTVPAKPLPPASVGVIQANAPAQAAPPGLVALLKTTESEKTPPPPGSTTTQPGGNPSVTAAPRKAPSNLKLRGTMAGGEGSGLAMIDVNGQTQVVGTGEMISGMTVKAVTPYSVSLEVNGQVQILEMESTGQLAGNSAPARTLAPRTQIQPQPQPTPEQNEDSGAIMTQKELRAILDNPAKFAGKGFRMKPVLKGGEIIGMRVAIKDASHPLARLGIQNGDVVRSLNGTPINGPEALSSIYRVLRNTSNLSFEVDRGGSSQKVEITLEE